MLSLIAGLPVWLFLKPNNSNLASFYNVWLRKILFGLKLFFSFFWLFFSKSKKKLVFSANFSFSRVKLVKAALWCQMLTPSMGKLIKLINENINYIIHTAVFVEVCPHSTFSTNHNLSTLILFENQNGIKASDNVI